MFVKICGTTSEEDALLAVAMGADAVGFILAPSTRQVAPVVVRDIVRRLPPEILTVGVFRDEAPERVVDVVRRTGLRAAQLHGRETPAQTAWVRARVPVVFKAFTDGDTGVARADEHEADAVLLDGPQGGSGQVCDWSTAGDVVARVDRVVLAGGLHAGNVGDAIAQVGPWGVDAASGLESAPGRKDPRALRAFVAAARAATLPPPTAPAKRTARERSGPEPGDTAIYDWQEDDT